MEDDVSPGSPTYSLESDFQVRQGRIEDIDLSEGDEICFPNLFQLLIFAAICFNWCCFFQPAFIKSFTPSFKTATSLSPPACKFVQKSANYDCGDKNVKLYINWCIIFGLDLCYTFSKHEMHSYCHKM